MENDFIRKAIRDAYQAGYNDGEAEFYNSEYVGRDRSKEKEIEGEDNAVDRITKEYIKNNIQSNVDSWTCQDCGNNVFNCKCE
jgi:hypothetical protein